MIENKPVTISVNPSKPPNDNIKTRLKNNSTPKMQEICGRESITNRTYIAYRTATGSAPTYFYWLLRIYVPSSSLRSASEWCLVVPSQRGSKSISITFSLTIPGWWNLPTPIPMGLRALPLSVCLFKMNHFIKVSAKWLNVNVIIDTLLPILNHFCHKSDYFANNSQDCHFGIMNSAIETINNFRVRECKLAVELKFSCNYDNASQRKGWTMLALL